MRQSSRLGWRRLPPQGGLCHRRGSRAERPGTRGLQCDCRTAGATVRLELSARRQEKAPTAVATAPFPAPQGACAPPARAAIGAKSSTREGPPCSSSAAGLESASAIVLALSTFNDCSGPAKCVSRQGEISTRVHPLRPPVMPRACNRNGCAATNLYSRRRHVGVSPHEPRMGSATTRAIRQATWS